jgi:hypothetical protein
MARGLKITHTETATGQIHDRYAMQQLVNGSPVGGTGGLTSQTGNQIAPRVKIGGNAEAAGSIRTQKGSKKFRVTDGTNTGVCTLVNLATPTAASTMSIRVDTATLTAGTANAYVVSGASTSAFVTGNFAGPVPLAVGQVVLGTGATGTVTITAVNTTSNVTVGYTSQTFANVAGGTFYTTVYASRISNKYVRDFGNNGNPQAGTIGGFNPNEYRYHLAEPDSIFVKVAYA